MPKFLKDKAVSLLDGGIETYLLGLYGLTLPTVKNRRAQETKYALVMGLFGAAAELLVKACLVQAYRDNSCTTSDRFVRILDFRHFERFFRFDQSDRKTYKKAISDGVNVSVVLDCGFGNTSKVK